MRVIGQGRDWISSELGDELMMMNIERGIYVGLNAMGAHIWRLIEAPRAVGDICAALVDAFEVDAGTCRAEVEAFVDKMEARGLVTVEEA
ncbi:PqqD family protein [Sphingomonas canadensis]|uniref:PqqD family protein n=1 Tax=Sphingomonas canadensis TaxID=1219257 RepID=A0ABW3HA12_9SPHN|nr:PqqD family protein [Sphingomonas canadensis]MCW3838135.1 PqqD family protein [Sphingomonas canadensis]